VDPTVGEGTPELPSPTPGEPEPERRAAVAEAEPDAGKTAPDSMALLVSGGGESSLGEG
jgi:hypothetical protein